MQTTTMYNDLAELIPNYFSNKKYDVPVDEKGLLNFIGENNCFLNVVIQSLWHLEPFRAKFTTDKNVIEAHHHEDKESCVYCSLEIIFTQYEFSDDAQIPPTALRRTMALLYKSQSKFQMFELDDASEAFEAVLSCLHNQYDKFDKNDSQITKRGDTCGNRKCIAHRIFGIRTVEEVECTTCGAANEPIQSTLFTAYAYAAQLRSVYSRNPTASFCEIISIAGADKRCCPNRENCDKMVPIKHSLLSLPEVFTISIVWDSATATVSEVESFLNMISWQIDLGNIFTLDNPKYSRYYQTQKSSCLYRLRGMICYYGKHYTAYFYSVKNQQWFVFDDSTVKPVGIDWPTIRSKCLKGHLQPSMLFYENDEPQIRITESMLEHPQIWKSNLFEKEYNEHKEDQIKEKEKERENEILNKMKEAVTKDNNNNGNSNDTANMNEKNESLNNKKKKSKDSKKVNDVKKVKKVSKNKSKNTFQHDKEPIQETVEKTEKSKPEDEQNSRTTSTSTSSSSSPATTVTLTSTKPQSNTNHNNNATAAVSGSGGSEIKISKLVKDDLEFENDIKRSIQEQEQNNAIDINNDNKDNNNQIKQNQPEIDQVMNIPRKDIEISNNLDDAEKIKTTETSSTTTLTRPRPQESFILLPSESRMDLEKDFVVTRTNWLYRRQERVFRFSRENFARILPNSLTIKETFEYRDVFDITVTDPQNMIIRFYSGKEAQYLQSDQNNEILDIIVRNSKLHHNHHFNIKRM